jgi:hypothetical protein
VIAVAPRRGPGWTPATSGCLSRLPDWHATPENLREEGSVVKADLRITGTHRGVLALPGMPSIPPTGKSFATRDRVVATLRGDQVAAITVEPGSPGIMEQLGVQPPTP